MNRYLIMTIGVAIAGCAVPAVAKDALPTNVTVKGNRVVDRVDWSFSPGQVIEFSKIKRCVATNLTNDEIQLKDSAGSWVGPATGNYYQNSNSTTVGGRDIFKMVDDNGKFLVAQGWIDKPVFTFRWILRFDLEVAVENSKVKMIMRNIKLAMSNTGSSSNDGFTDLNTSYRFKQNYATLEEAATSVKSCIMG